jgi:hypothetical protein
MRTIQRPGRPQHESQYTSGSGLQQIIHTPRWLFTLQISLIHSLTLRSLPLKDPGAPPELALLHVEDRFTFHEARNAHSENMQ